MSPNTPAASAMAVFDSLMPWEEYQRANERIFPTPESFRWLLRQHRAELIERGGLCYLAGRIFVVTTVFEAMVIEIGQRLAATRATRSAPALRLATPEPEPVA